MKALKVILWLIGVLVFLALGAVLVLTTVVDPNQFKPRIATAVEQASGRKLSMPGELKLSFYPWLGVETGEFSLSNPPGFGDQPMLKAKQAKVRIKIMPLLKKKLEIGRVLLDGAQINLMVNKKGKNNWSGFAADKASPKQTEDSPLALGALAVKGLQISDGRLSFANLSNGQKILFDDIDLETGALELGQPTTLELAMTLSGGGLTQPTRVNLNTELAVNEELNAVTLTASELSIALAEAIKLTMAKVDYNMLTDTLNIPAAKVTQADAVANISIEGNQLSTSPRVSGKVNIPTFDLNKTLLHNGIKADIPASLGQAVGADLDYRYTATGVEVTNLKATAGQLNLRGNLKVLNPTSPKYVFDLLLDKLDIDSLMPVKAGQKTEQATAAQILLPLEPLRKLNLDGRLKIDEFRSAGIKLRNFDIQIKASKGRISVAPIKANVAGGKLDSAIVYRVAAEQAMVDVKTRFNAVDIGILLKDLEITDRLEGKGNLTADLNAKGRDVDALIASLGGKIGLSMLDGAIKGFDLQKMLIKAKSLGLGGKQLNAETNTERKTRFAELKGSFVAAKGVLNTRNLSMKAPAIRLIGHGNVNLVSQLMDLKLDLNVVDTIRGQGGESLDDLKGAKIPFAIDGPISAPRYRLDLASLFKDRLKKELKQELARKLGVNEAVSDQVKEEILADPVEALKEKLKKKLLKGIFD